MTRTRRLFWTTVIMLIAALVARGMQPYFDDTNVAMAYMLAVVVVAFLLGLGPAVLTCLLGVLLFDFFNVEPYFAFTMHVFNYLFTLAVMLVTAATISTLADRLRQQVAESEDRAARTAALYALSAELADGMEIDGILAITSNHIARAFSAHVTIVRHDTDDTAQGKPAITEAALPAGAPAALTAAVAKKEKLTTGLAADGTVMITLPLYGDGRPLASLTLQMRHPWQAGGEQESHLRAMARLAEQAIERAGLREQIHASEARIQQESLRSSIFGAVSHDLRTPLASIIGASSTLLAKGDEFAPEARNRLRSIIYEEAVHMQRMIENLLDLARLRSGDIGQERGWQAIEEIVGSTMASMRRRITDHEFVVDVPANLPLIRCDGVLIERVLSNIVENAAKYSPAHSRISLEALRDGKYLVLRVSDEGPGIPESLREKVFEPFFRNGTASGSGLGLAICRGIVEAHDGEIQIGSTSTGGACVSILLPLPASGDSPALEREEIARSA